MYISKTEIKSKFLIISFINYTELDLSIKLNN